MSNLEVMQKNLSTEVSVELLERINDVAENIQAVDNFKLPKIKVTSDGFELTEGEELTESFEGIILQASRFNIFYEKTYNPKQITAPDCFSRDGVKPDASVLNPVNATCKGCPKAEFGTNQMGSGKACRNLKPLYILLSETAVLPKVLAVSPTSLKAIDKYLLDLTSNGYNYRKVKTKFTAYKEDKKDTYSKIKFQFVAKLDDKTAKDVEHIKSAIVPLITKNIESVMPEEQMEVSNEKTQY